MGKRILALILCICLVMTACSKKNTNEVSVTKYDEDKFELTAIKSDKQGMDNVSGFQLTCKDNVDKKYIKDNLQIIPQHEFKVEKMSQTIYNIIPLTKLENDKVYQVKLNDEPHEYSWAFQTKKQFKVEETIPADESNYVPVNSGIEMLFSLGNFEDIDNYFEITPKAEGKFIKNDKTVVFAPEKLENNTRYTVTIKNGFGLVDGSEKLKEDYVFSFNTESDQNSKIYFESPLINICESNTKVIGAYVNSKYNETEFTINIFEYKDDDGFAADVKQYAETGKFPVNVKEESKFVNINTINQKPFIKEAYTYRDTALFQLPEELKKGYYLLEFSAEGFNEKKYLFLQINDMLIYNAIFQNEVFVFAGDSITSKGIKNASIYLNDEKIGKTDENGTLTYTKKASDYKTVFMRVEAQGYNDFIYADSSLFRYNYYSYIGEEYNYFKYIDTDRGVYLPTDTVNVWGFARLRDNKAINKVKIDLIDDVGVLLESKYVDLTDIGTYEAQFELNNITSSNLKIEVYDNEVKIASKYIEVRKYSKPLFTMDGKPSKKAVYSGDELSYTINANFFDGYPVPNLKLKLETYCYGYYYDGSTKYENMQRDVTLNEDGEATININTVVKSEGWRPEHIEVNCYNAQAEDQTVNLHNNFIVFPKNKMIEMQQSDVNKPQSVDILFHELVIDKYDTDEFYDYSSLRGKTIDDKIHVVIYEKYYEKFKIGEEYDFINKVNQVIYDYNLVEDVVYEGDVNTALGVANIEIPNMNKERDYKVVASYYDEENGSITEEFYVHGRMMPYERLYYSLEKLDIKESYRLKDVVNMQLEYNDEVVENVENDNLVLMFARNGLIESKVFEDTKIQFLYKENFISNVSMQGAYIKGGYLYPVSAGIYYDRTERQIYFDVTTNKEEYRPGEEVTLNIRTFDENNKPCVADVNISVVDEAYFAIFQKSVHTLDNLYTGSWSTGIIKDYLSNKEVLTPDMGGAEKGGGGGEDAFFRDEFKDTNIFKTLRTDKNGKATIKFKLADNLTSWRITYQAISDKMYAGSGTKNIAVSLPFYVDLIMGDEYLKDDKINASLRVFGYDANESEEVSYKVSVVNKETGKKTEYNEKGVVGGYTNVLLGNLDEGNYEIYVTASSKNKKDAIKEGFRVVDSYVYFNNTDYYKLTDKTVLEEVYSNPVITLFNESNSDFYNSLDAVSSSNGIRIDQTVCSMLAKKYINEYFKTDLDFNEEELFQKISEYDVYGGIKLFPYSEADPQVTAKLADMVENEYLNSKFKTYFKRILNNEAEYSVDVAAALWGLSQYKEPVLLTIYDLLENSDLETRDKLYLSLALIELGDKKTANKYYKELSGNLINLGDYLYCDNKISDVDNYEITALLSVLGVKLNNFDTSDKLFKYIYNKPSKKTLSNFEQLSYIMNRDIMELEEIKDLFGEVTVTVDGSNETYKLKLFDRESFAIAKEKIKDVKFSNINGSIACKVDALGNKDDLDKNKTDDMSLKISYMLKNSSKEQMKYNQSDVLKVSIMPSFAPDIENGIFEITYIIPSGFRYIEAGEYSWADIDGQKLKFNFYYDKKVPYTPLVFYMQAAQTGEYTVDYAVIKEIMETRLNYVEKTKLTIN